MVRADGLARDGTKGWFDNVAIGDLQLGFEITSSSGGLNCTLNSESITSS
ncbi:hypothetical protein AB0M11_31420 [Streptomyces sp. NPDC051987]